MANDCLLTKLKGVVDNQELLKYNAIRFKVNLSGVDLSGVSNAEKNLYVDGGTITSINGKTFDVLNGGGTETIATNVTTFTNPSWFQIIPKSEDYIFDYSQKYNLKGWGCSNKISENIEIDISQFNYSKLITQFSFTNSGGNSRGIIGTLDTTLLTEIQMLSINQPGNDFHFNLQTLSGCTKLTVISITGADIKESIENFPNLVLITNINFADCSNVEGEITTLCAAIAENKTSGTIRFALWNTNTTINGVPFNEVVQDTPGGYYAWADFSTSYQDGYQLRYQNP